MSPWRMVRRDAGGQLVPGLWVEKVRVQGFFGTALGFIRF